MVARLTKWTLAVGGCGAVLILLGGILGWVAFPAVVKTTVADTVALKKDSDAWGRWTELPLPMNFKIYIYDVQNPLEVTAGEHPQLIERGPYVYTETRFKEDIAYREEEDRVGYYQRSFFEFDAEASNGTEDDLVTVPNIPLISFAQITDSIGPLASSISSLNDVVDQMFTNQQGIFTTVTVHDYIFGGIPMYCNQSESLTNIPVLIMCAAYAHVAPRTVTLGLDGINLFSFFGFKNNKTDGYYEVGLGIDEVESIGNVFRWEHGTHTDKWGDDSCNAIYGTDSTIFRPDLDDVDELTIFNTDICRTIKLTYKEDIEFQGIAGRRYVTTKDVFAGVKTNQDNYCYCPQSVSNLTAKGGCLKDGILELSSCQGAPVILSHPHYLFADESYNVYNMTPTEADDQIFLDLEPYTGTPLRGASKIQMNVLLRPIEEVEIMKNFQGIMLPVIRMEEGVELNDELLDMLHEELFDTLDILNGVRWALIGVGIALFCGSIGFYVLKK